MDKNSISYTIDRNNTSNANKLDGFSPLDRNNKRFKKDDDKRVKRGGYTLSFFNGKVKKSFPTLEARAEMSECLANRSFKSSIELINFVRGATVVQGGNASASQVVDDDDLTEGGLFPRNVFNVSDVNT